MKRKYTSKEALEMQKRAGIITESEYNNMLNEAEEDEPEEDDLDPEEFYNRMMKALEPNKEPPVWKSVLAADKETRKMIDEKIEKLYPGAVKLKSEGPPIWGGLDPEAETTVPIARYAWDDPEKPEDVPDDPEELDAYLEENDDLWIVQINVQKHEDTGDIAYWEILVNGETNDPYGEPSGFLTGEYAVDPDSRKSAGSSEAEFDYMDSADEIYDEVVEYMKNGGKGDLYYNHASAKNIYLPKNLKVGGSLNLQYSAIVSLPAGLEVAGSLLVFETPLTSLPDNLKVGHNLFVNDTKLTSLPRGLEVVNNLRIWNTKISSLPKDLKVGTLDVNDSPLEKYTEKQIKAMALGVKNVDGAAESFTSKIAKAGGLPKGTPGGDEDTEYGDRTNE